MRTPLARFRWLAFVAVALTFLLVLSGGAVRVAEMGMGCAGWPLCDGRLVPPSGGRALAYAHRLAVLVAGVAVLATAVAAWRMSPRRRGIVIPATVAAALLGVQVALSGLMALSQRPSSYAAVHFGLAMALFAALLIVMVTAFAEERQEAGTAAPATEGFAFLAAGTALAIFALLLTGAYVTGEGAQYACRGWPLCNGEIFPGDDRLTDINAFHRLSAAAAGVLVGVLIWQALTRRRGDRALVLTSVVAGALFIVQVFIGAGNVWLRLADWVRVAHLGMATLVWGTLVVTASLAFTMARASSRTATAPAARHAWRETVAAYVGLTKPRIIELLLVTTVPAMVLAQRGMPHPLLILGTLFGGTLTAGGANAINCYIDRDIDQVMHRTRHRSLPSRRVRPEHALVFGIVISVLGFLELAVLINLLSAVLAVSAILFYVFVYTLWLKRSTVQNIVIGGAAGAVPPLVGWAAVTGRLDLPALVLFAIIFLWTPPHFWALALRYRSDYAAAQVPMLPVARGEEATRRQIFWYSLVLVACTLLLYVTGGAGVVYLAVALMLGAALIRMAWQLLRTGETFPVMKLFTYSITYLAALFGAMVLDQAVRSFA